MCMHAYLVKQSIVSDGDSKHILRVLPCLLQISSDIQWSRSLLQ